MSLIQPMEGVSLRPAFLGRSLRRTQPLFWEHEGNRAVRSGNWKLVSTYPDDWELYDLAADRVERNNLAARRPDIVRKSGDRMERLGRAGPRGSLARAAAAALGRRCAGCRSGREVTKPITGTSAARTP